MDIVQVGNILQVDHGHGWQDFSTIKDTRDAEVATDAVKSQSFRGFGGRFEAGFRVVKAGSMAVVIPYPAPCEDCGEPTHDGPCITVVCAGCGGRYIEGRVQFLNIEEDHNGVDVLTFECPTCKVTVTSHRYG